MELPRAGIHYPGSLGEFQTWFQTDADCLDYLEWLRWPSEFVCPECGHASGWRLGDGRFGVRHGSMRQTAAVKVTATGGQIHGPKPELQAGGGAGVRPER